MEEDNDDDDDLLGMRNVSDRSCRENQNTHFMFKNVYPKIIFLMS